MTKKQLPKVEVKTVLDDATEDFIVDHRTGMTMSQYAEFFTPCCDRSKIKTNGKCPVNNRSNDYSDEVPNTSITAKFERFSRAVAGISEDGSRMLEPSAKQIKQSRKKRGTNAQDRTKRSPN